MAEATAQQFKGKLITVQPNKAVYDVGETAILHVVADTTYYASWDWTGEWRTFYDVWNDEGKVIAKASHLHSISPFTKEDYAHNDFKLSLGAVKKSQRIKIRLVAMPSLLSGKYFFLDDKLIDILVVGKEMPEYVEPVPKPDEPTPTPIPTEPTPTPIPIKYQTCPYCGALFVTYNELTAHIQDKHKGEAIPTEEAETNIWLWVIIGIAVLALIAVFVKRGRK